jgi:phosphoglycolate phosphatase
MLEQIVEHLAVPAARTVMIGDTTHDLQMAINAGTAGLGVSYGAHPRENLAELAPLGLFDSFGELDNWLIQYG